MHQGRCIYQSLWPDRICVYIALFNYCAFMRQPEETAYELIQTFAIQSD